MLDRLQRFHSVDGHRRGANPLDMRAHGNQHRTDIDDLGLACGVVDDRASLGSHGRHDQRLGSPDTGEVQPDVRALEPLRRRDQIAVFVHDLGTHALESVDVQVQAAGPMLSPPGSATSASPQRDTNGPRTQIEARILRTRS